MGRSRGGGRGGAGSSSCTAASGGTSRRGGAGTVVSDLLDGRVETAVQVVDTVKTSVSHDSADEVMNCYSRELGGEGLAGEVQRSGLVDTAVRSETNKTVHRQT